MQKSHYLADLLQGINGVSLASTKPFFREFAVGTPKPGHEIAAQMQASGYLVGPVLDDLDVGVNHGLLLSVTELRTKEEMDTLAEAMGKDCLSGEDT